MDKKILNLLEKIIKSSKYKFTGIHTLTCNNTCIFALFETVYCLLNKTKRISCQGVTGRSSKFVLEGNTKVDTISSSGGVIFHLSEDDLMVATTKEELLKKLKNL